MAETPPSHPNALPTGYLLREYRIEEVLGVGGFGITYRAKHESFNNKYVAIKEYLPATQAFRTIDSRVDLLSNGDQTTFDWGLERFFDEANHLHDLRHPSIVAVENVFKENGTAYMVMDVVRGVSTAELIKQRTVLTETQLWSLFDQLTDALRTIHEAGLIHRDISPSNILFRQRAQRAVLIDFGSSKAQLEQTQLASGGDHTRIFTPGYAPLEQHEGTPQDQRSDVYGLAASLYHLALHVRPAPSAQRAGALRSGQDPLIPAREIGAGRFSKEFLETLDRGLALLPEHRPASVNDWCNFAHKSRDQTITKPLPVELLREMAEESDRDHTTSDKSAGTNPITHWLAGILPPDLARRIPTSFAKTDWSVRNLGIAAAAFVGLLLLAHATHMVDLPGITTSDRLIERAARTLKRGPLEPETLLEASSDFTKAKLLGNGSDRARTGELLCEEITAYRSALVDRDLHRGESLLPIIDGLASDVGATDFPIEQLRSAFTYESSYRDFENLSQSILPGDGDLDRLTELLARLGGMTSPLTPAPAERLAQASKVADALGAANGAVAEQRFAVALDRLDAAQQAIANISDRPLEFASARASVRQARSDFVARETQQAIDQSLAEPTATDVLTTAGGAINRVLNVDQGAERAVLWRDVLSVMGAALARAEQAETEEALAILSQADARAQRAGISAAAWREVSLRYESLAAQNELDQRLTALVAQPFAESQQDSLRESIERAGAVINAGRASQMLQQRRELADAALQSAREVGSLTAREDYAGADSLASGSAEGLAELGLQQSLREAINGARRRDIADREAKVQGELQVYQLGNSRSPLRYQLDQIDALQPDRALVNEIRGVLARLDRVEQSAGESAFAAATEALRGIPLEVQTLALAPGFIDNQLGWLQERAGYAAANVREAELARLANEPLDPQLQDGVATRLDEAIKDLQQAGFSAANLQSLAGIVPRLRSISEHVEFGRFSAARGDLDTLRGELSASGGTSERLQRELDSGIRYNERTFARALTRRVRSGADGFYATLLERPLDLQAQATVLEELQPLLKLQRETDPELTDWSEIDQAQAVQSSLSAATKLLQDETDYLPAAKALVATSIALPAGSRWRRVLERGRSSLENQKDTRLRSLLQGASMALNDPSDASVYDAARQQYRSAASIEKSADGLGALGVRFVDLLESVRAALAARDISRIDLTALEQQSGDFQRLPGVAGVLAGVRGESQAVLDAAHQAQTTQVQTILATALSEPLDAAALRTADIALTELTASPISTALPDAATQTQRAQASVRGISEAVAHIENRRFESAYAALNTVSGAAQELGNGTLVTTVAQTLSALNDNVRQYRLARRPRYINELKNALAAIAADPSAAANLSKAENHADSVLAEHAEFADALIIKEVLASLKGLSPGVQGGSACAGIDGIRDARARIDYPLFDWSWLEPLAAGCQG
ncbi:MAG: serine/threonine-protein kinase [Pseudomonadota bacterium]